MRNKTRKILTVGLILVSTISPEISFAKEEKAANTKTTKHEAVKVFSQKPNSKGAFDFVATTIEGKRISLEDLRGKVVVMNFWATWCPPCMREMPAVEQLASRYKNKGLVVISVNVEDAATAREFLFMGTFL